MLTEFSARAVKSSSNFFYQGTTKIVSWTKTKKKINKLQYNNYHVWDFLLLDVVCVTLSCWPDSSTPNRKVSLPSGAHWLPFSYISLILIVCRPGKWSAQCEGGMGGYSRSDWIGAEESGHLGGWSVNR